MKKNIAKKILIVIFIIIAGGFGGIIADRYLFPYLSTTSLFKKCAFLKKGADDVTIINKTEQVFVKEETSIAKISNQASSSVVSVVSFPVSATTQKNNASTINPQYNAGLIVTSDGLIMTYAADRPVNMQYRIIAADGKNYDAEVLGVDSFSNLLFLKINANNLPAVSFGNSDDIKAGEKTIEIGVSQGNSDHVYSAGLISNFDSFYNLSGGAISSSEKLEGMFKGDFKQEKGYIGGPVVDYNGQVIGIVGEIAKNGVSDFFQIPSNKISKIIDRAIKKELDQNSVLGVYYLPLNESYAAINNLKVNKGALVYSASGQQGLAILSGSSAQKAGLQINDIITKVNDAEINPGSSLSWLLYQYKKGDKIELTVLRGEEELKIPVQL